MQRNKKEKATKPLAPSQSGRRRGEVEESKAAKILMTVGVGVLITLVVALIVALIVVSLSNKKPAESPVKDEIHLTYQDVVTVVVDKNIMDLNQGDNVKAYLELVKETSYMIFYREKDLKNKDFLDAITTTSDDKTGVVLINLDLHSEILGAEDTVLKELEYSSPNMLPFVIVISESQSKFEFVGLMEDVLKLLGK